ncbi:type II secretion system minor pseudopilin GspH [Vibrio algarum]|uniref:Type II secretion system protein H n=1 Tax=Vibrio algarum TaxID=3020714 RepID=A0ABT4YLS6_9VIBR|nr:type II secretion system minor pseudopilin GspH [Vibrio sp. KJ40-1]MDB1122499.1 type II secretion system minor pseudopilin GspH [Vibrio sp. KJ40-1]
MKRKNAGFTLIEIMLVIVLMSLSAVAVIFNLPDSKQDIAKEQAQRFYYRIQLLNEHAILNGKDLGIRVDEKKGTYSYLQLESDGWQLFENKIYTETTLQDGVKLSFELGGDAWSQNESFFKQESLFDEDMFAELESENKIKPPQLFVLSSGEMTPFRLSIFSVEDKDNGWVVDVKESGSIDLIHAQDIQNENDTR